MTNKKQTAVEWLIKRIENFNLIKKGNLDNELFRQIELEAKEIQEQQIKDAREDGIVSVMRADITKQIQSNSEYYNETYGGDNGKL